MKTREEIETRISAIMVMMKKLPPDTEPHKILAISSALRELEWVLSE